MNKSTNHHSPLQTKTFKTGTFLIVILMGLMLSTACASDPVAIMGNLSTLIFSLIKAVGIILLLFGLVQLGLSLKSHDPSQRANSFLTILGGLVVAFAQEILTLIGAM